MNSDEPWTLKGPNNFSEELLFDEIELTIHRNFLHVYINILMGLLLTALAVTFIVNDIGQGKDYRIILYVVQFALSITVLTMGLMTFFKTRRMNKRTFTYTELKQVKAEITNRMVGINFRFKDGTRDRISVVKTGYYSLFIELLKTNSVEVIEISKR